MKIRLLLALTFLGACFQLTPGDRAQLADDANKIEQCQEQGRACKADGGTHCKDTYNDCMKDAGLH